MVSAQQVDDRETKAVRMVTTTFAEVFRAYVEASNEVQAVIREMCLIYNDSESDSDERDAAIATLVEALFPVSHNGELGIDVNDLDRVCSEASREFKEAIQVANDEQTFFSDRLAKLIDAKNIDQNTLANLIGVKQPAISMMLTRNCKPQRGTVKKLAAALDVKPEELWPSYKPD